MLPPFTGEDVKFTLVPEQIVVAEAVMPMLTGRFGFTVIVIGFDVAGLPVAQVSLEVMMQVTMFPSARLLLEYEVPVPTTVLFTFH